VRSDSDREREGGRKKRNTILHILYIRKKWFSLEVKCEQLEIRN